MESEAEQALFAAKIYFSADVQERQDGRRGGGEIRDEADADALFDDEEAIRFAGRRGEGDGSGEGASELLLDGVTADSRGLRHFEGSVGHACKLGVGRNQKAKEDSKNDPGMHQSLH